MAEKGAQLSYQNGSFPAPSRQDYIKKFDIRCLDQLDPRLAQAFKGSFKV